MLSHAGHPIIGHDGGINGFVTSLLRMPEDHVLVIILCNNTSAEQSPGYLARKIAALTVGKPIKEKAAIQVDPKILESYVGVYRIDETNKRIVTREGSRLFAQRTPGPRVEIFPESETDFFLKNSFVTLSFKVRHSVFQERCFRKSDSHGCKPGWL